MTLTDILQTLLGLGGGAILIILLGVIKIKPLEISVWSWLFRKMGSAFNGEVIDRFKALDDRIDTLEDKLDSHISGNEEHAALNCRKRILAFDSSLYKAINAKRVSKEDAIIFYHTKEEFNDVLEDITKYNHYCETHPNFANDKCIMAITHIKEIYKICLEKNSFV